MPRPLRFLPTNTPAHLVQRAVDRRTIFETPRDFDRFLNVIGEANERFPVRLLAYCVMPNHWHLLAISEARDGIPDYMQWLTGTHAQRHRRRRGTIGLGHIYKGRYWGTPIQDDRYFFTVLRYIEGNALRAGLVPRAELWRWSSAWERMSNTRGLLSPLPVSLPDDWNDLLNLPRLRPA